MSRGSAAKPRLQATQFLEDIRAWIAFGLSQRKQFSADLDVGPLRVLESARRYLSIACDRIMQPSGVVTPPARMQAGYRAVLLAFPVHAGEIAARGVGAPAAGLLHVFF